MRRFGHQVHRHAETAVAAQLHQHAGVEHRHGGRCRCVTVGAPGVEREEGAQHAEADEDHREPDVLLREGNVVQRGDLVQVHRLRPGAEVDAQDAAEQQGRPAHEHQRQLHGRILLAAAATDADEQVHRDQCHFVEHEHREEIDGDEESEDTDREQAEPEEVGFDVGLHLPRGERAREDDDGRQ